jgi:3D-(3,5/4)-trihydroxycyclohexane-1,2-dione acylhydrolase (decyclizing)
LERLRFISPAFFVFREQGSTGSFPTHPAILIQVKEIRLENPKVAMKNKPNHEELTRQRAGHAKAYRSGSLPRHLDLTLSEALVLGLLRQGVKTYFSVLGHGSTEVGEVLRVYQEAGLLKVYGLRSEIEASHAATALRWVSGKKAAVVTSIGPGALQALAASIVPASDGIGVWYLFGDETTEDEGFNMQQIPKHGQGLFLQMAATMGSAYSLHTPLALPSALQRGAAIVNHPTRPGPFYLLLPMNTQAAWLADFNLDELPDPGPISLGPAEGDYALAAQWLQAAGKVVVKVGGGGRDAGTELTVLLERTGGVLVHTPIATGCIPYHHPQNMTIGGSKGSLCGNYAMEHADLLIAVGTRAVCQSDCSRTGYPEVKRVININADLEDANHYNHTLALVGDVRRTLAKLNQELGPLEGNKMEWLEACAGKKAAWQAFKEQRISTPILADEYWAGPVLTQPAAIKIATDWAKRQGVICFFDAGDVQANGFQIVEDERPGQTFTEAGASYMGFAVSALLATGVATRSFRALALTGDGSFTMNPQILIDGVEHGARGCILLLDNGRMGAITGLQEAQFGTGFATWNSVHVDYLAWAGAVRGLLALDGGHTPETLTAALQQAEKHPGLSLIHLPVYYGPDPLGGMGVYGRWNVGNWSEDVQRLRNEIGL